MAQDKTPLVWVDMEMSGLVPDRDRILEVALVVTDAELNTLAEAPVYVVHQPDEVLEAMDSWNRATHGKSGLVDKVRASTFTEAEVERRIVEFLKPLVAERAAPLAGNTVHQDRPLHGALHAAVRAYLHYRIVDVSHAQGARQALEPGGGRGCRQGRQARGARRRHESIEELRHYRRRIPSCPRPSLLEGSPSREPSRASGPPRASFGQARAGRITGKHRFEDAVARPHRRDLRFVLPEAAGQAGEVGRAQRGGLGDPRAHHRHAQQVAWICMSRLEAVAPPSTRNSVSAMPESALMASMSSALWKAIASSVALARWARVVPRVMPTIGPARTRVPIGCPQPRERRARR
jgi:oligoribonuclease